MPTGKEGQVSGQQKADITSFMLQVNSFPAGATVDCRCSGENRGIGVALTSSPTQGGAR
jgi:hypothetical protein